MLNTFSPGVVIRLHEQQACKASHCGSKYNRDHPTRSFFVTRLNDH